MIARVFRQVRHRLVAVFVFVALLTGVVGVLGQGSVTAIGEMTRIMTTLITPAIRALQDLRFAGQRIVATAHDEGRPTPSPTGSLESDFSGALSRYLSLERQMPHPSVETLERLPRVCETLLSRCSPPRALAGGDFRHSAQDGALARCLEAEAEFLSLLETLIQTERQQLSRLDAELRQRIDETVRTIRWGIALALSISLVAAFALSRSISRPLRLLREGAERLRQGEYAWRIPRSGLDEFGELSRAFNDMAASLESAIESATRARRYLENVVATMGEAVIVTTAGRQTILANDAARELLGVGKKEHLIDHLFVDPDEPARLTSQIISSGRLPFRETVLNGGQYREIPVEMAAAPVPLPDGKRGIVWIFHDITERKRSEEEIRRLAFYDPLTGLPNRALFKDRCTQALHISAREKGYVAILLIDLDHFKEVNETLGHARGDELLEEIAHRLSSVVRRNDTLARLGGDEFVVMSTSQGSSEGVSILAEKLLEKIVAPVRLGGREFCITASIGISLYPSDGEEVQTLLAQADMALYAAKEKGRNRFCFYSSGMNEALKERKEIEERLRRAVSEGELYLEYQPQYDLSTDRMLSVEVLVRWRDPERGTIPPDRFIGVAEQTGIIHDLGEWVLREACLQAVRWSEMGLPPVRIAVNISGKQFADPSFIETLDRILAETGLNPARLELELTESILMENTRTAIETLVDMKVRGIHLAIDDFGTGYSSLSYLKFIPLDRLKIDRTFVRDIIDDPDDAAIVTAIIGLSHSLGLKVIAEGVESAAQMAFLKEHGCDEVQGYFTGRPLHPDGIASLLRHSP